MKLERHSRIVELIGKYEIETQEELADYLQKAGYHVCLLYTSSGWHIGLLLREPWDVTWKAAVSGQSSTACV